MRNIKEARNIGCYIYMELKMVLKEKQRQIFQGHIGLVILIAAEQSVIRTFREKKFSCGRKEAEWSYRKIVL